MTYNFNKVTKPDRKLRKVCPQCHKLKEFQPSRKLCASCRAFNYQVAKGHYRAPGITDVNVENYKEPMQKAKGGFGYYGAITTTNDGKHIQCHICGYYIGNLASHIRFGHKVAPSEYKDRFGLRAKEGLLSPVKRFEAQTNYNKFARKTPEQYRQFSRAGHEAQTRKGGYKRMRNSYSPQRRNEEGNCKDQTIAKIRHVAEILGGRPSKSAYMKEYGSGSESTVEMWFGSWDEGVEASGYKSYMEHRQALRKTRMATVEVMIRTFYNENGRTPSTSDFDSTISLPSAKNVRDLYGSMNNARIAAGVPSIMWYKGAWTEVPNAPDKA